VNIPDPPVPTTDALPVFVPKHAGEVELLMAAVTGTGSAMVSEAVPVQPLASVAVIV